MEEQEVEKLVKILDEEVLEWAWVGCSSLAVAKIIYETGYRLQTPEPKPALSNEEVRERIAAMLYAFQQHSNTEAMSDKQIWDEWQQRSSDSKVLYQDRADWLMKFVALPRTADLPLLTDEQIIDCMEFTHDNWTLEEVRKVAEAQRSLDQKAGEGK